MADVIKSIRSDGTGDYTTIAAWEGDLDLGSIYSAGDHAIGELYNEDYAEQCTINGGSTIGLSAVTLRANAANRHTGRPGTGARVTHANQHYFGIASSSIPVSCEFIEFNGSGNTNNDIWNSLSLGTSRLRNCIVWNYAPADSTANCYLVRDRGGGDFECDNNLVFGGLNTGTSRITGILLSDTGTGNRKARNNTVTDISNTNATSGNAQGINFGDIANRWVENNLVTNINSTAGTAECYDNLSTTTATSSGNVCDDASGPQTHLRNAEISFEDAANDIYWPGPGDTMGWGKATDLGTGQIALDLLGRDRDAANDSWDAGAFQHVTGQTPYFVGGASGSVTSGTSVTVTVSGIDIQEGDVIVAVCHSNSNTGNWTGDGTYTFTNDFEETNPCTPDDGTYAVLTRVAGAAEPTSYQFNQSGSTTRNEVQLSVFRNVHGDIWEVAPSTSTRAFANSGTTATSPTLTTVTDGALGIVFALRDSGATTGYTDINEGYTNEVSLGVSGDQCTFMWSRMFLSAGSQPAVDATLSADDAHVIHQLALKPADLHTIIEVGYASDGELNVSATSGSVTHGIDIQDGDFVVAMVHVNLGTNTISDNNGANSFTERVPDRDHAGASSTYAIFDRSAGASEPASYSFNGWTAAEWSIAIGVFRNTNGWDVAPNTANEATQSSGTSLVMPSITPTQTDTLTLGIHGSDSDPFTFGTVDNGFVYKRKEETGRSAAFVGKYTPAASAVGATTVSWTGTNDMVGMLAALAPAGTGPVITDVDTDETWDDGATGLVITGTGFM